MSKPASKETRILSVEDVFHQSTVYSRQDGLHFYSSSIGTTRRPEGFHADFLIVATPNESTAITDLRQAMLNAARQGTLRVLQESNVPVAEKDWLGRSKTPRHAYKWAPVTIDPAGQFTFEQSDEMHVYDWKPQQTL